MKLFSISEPPWVYARRLVETGVAPTPDEGVIGFGYVVSVLRHACTNYDEVCRKNRPAGETYRRFQEEVNRRITEFYRV